MQLEIQEIIQEKNLVPDLIEGKSCRHEEARCSHNTDFKLLAAMVKQISWDG